MLEIHERLGERQPPVADAYVVLRHEQRDKGRLRTITTNGEEVRIFLDRGQPLAVGEFLKSRCGRFVVVEGAREEVVTAHCEDWRRFSRACYHLGNRHVKVQLGERWLRILPDHVLEDLLRRLGLELRRSEEIFIPESGAYGHAHHAH